jgi:hypothetical protein
MAALFTFNGLNVISTPASPAPSSLVFTNTDFSAPANNPFSGSQQIVDWQASMLSASVQLPPMSSDGGGDDWSAFLMECRGMVNAFLIGDPTKKTPRGSMLVTGAAPLVDGASQQGYQLKTKGWQANKTGVLKRGDWVQIIYRLHKVLNDVDTDADGKATLDIYPQIRETPADGQALVTTNAQGLFRLASNTNNWSINLAAIYGMEFKIREAF